MGRTLGLSLATDISCTIGFATVAGLWISSISIDVVVEDQLFACFDFPLGKNSHPQFVTNHPFIDIAVGVAGVIAESTQISFLSSVNKFVLREGHEIEMLDALIVVLDGASTKIGFIDNLSNILKNEFMRSQISIGS